MRISCSGLCHCIIAQATPYVSYAYVDAYGFSGYSYGRRSSLFEDDDMIATIRAYFVSLSICTGNGLAFVIMHSRNWLLAYI